jgi:hypothetical protein
VTTVAERTREISERWRGLVELPGRWRRSSSQAGGLLVAEKGEAGGFFVELDAAPGRRAYLKPLKRPGEFIFLDYAFSMGVSGSWATEGFRACRAAPFPPRMCSSLITPVLEETLQKIEAFSQARIEEVVNRIPWQWLPDADKQLIVTGLLGRRQLVRPALGSYLRSTP